MPILIPDPVVTDPVPFPTQPPPTIPPRPPVRRPSTRTQLVWVGPEGDEWVLTGNGMATRGVLVDADGLQGLGAADPVIRSDPRFGGGASVQHIYTDPKHPTIPVLLWDENPLTFVDLFRSFSRSFTATKRLGPGRFIVRRPDGTSRALVAYYESGLDPTITRGNGATRVALALGLFVEDPFFRSEVEETRGGEYALPRDYLNPYMTVSAAQQLGETSVNYHDGDVESWPRWRFTPPWSRIEVRHRTAGKAFTITRAGLEFPVTVDTDPTAMRVVADSGENWMPYLDWPGARLWPLEPGVNDITVQMDGAGPGTSWQMEFYRRYETA